MRQAYCIIRKDLGRLWIETLVSAVALCLLTWTEWRLCTSARNPRWYNQVIPTVAVFFSWWFLVVRLIQGEALVGDRQFWVTRPYIWYKLLAAKALFVAAFVAAPLVISQIALLLWDRGPVLENLAGVISRTGGAMLVGILPIAACAVMTRDLPRWIMCAVALLLLLIGMVWLDTVTPDSHVPTGWDISDNLQAVAFASLTLIGVTLRYARRHSRWGSVAIIAGFAAVPVVLIMTPYRAIIAARFPIVEARKLPFRVKFVPAEGPFTDVASASDDHHIRLIIPIEISEMPEELLPRVDGVMLSIDLPNGQRHDSEWQTDYQRAPQEGKPHFLSVEIDRSILDRVKAYPIPARLSVAVSQIEDRHRQRIVARRAFELPGVGSCWLDGFVVSVVCRSTTSGPPLVMATVREEERTCPAESNRVNASSQVIRSLNSNSAEGPLTPLTLRTFDVGRVCPGTPLHFSAPEVVRRFQFEVPLGLLRLRQSGSPRLAL